MSGRDVTHVAECERVGRASLVHVDAGRSVHGVGGVLLVVLVPRVERGVVELGLGLLIVLRLVAVVWREVLTGVLTQVAHQTAVLQHSPARTQDFD